MTGFGIGYCGVYLWEKQSPMPNIYSQLDPTPEHDSDKLEYQKQSQASNGHVKYSSDLNEDYTKNSKSTTDYRNNMLNF